MDEKARAAWAAKIKPARVARGLTQRDVADMSGVSLKTVGNIESGRLIPQAANLRKLMVALDLGPNPMDNFPDWVAEWIAVIAPLIQAIPQPPRNQVMTEVVMILGNAAAGRYPDNVTSLTRNNNVRSLDVADDSKLGPDGMPPFDERELLAARRVSDDQASLRPKAPNPEDYPDDEGPESGA